MDVRTLTANLSSFTGGLAYGIPRNASKASPSNPGMIVPQTHPSRIFTAGFGKHATEHRLSLIACGIRAKIAITTTWSIIFWDRSRTVPAGRVKTTFIRALSELRKLEKVILSGW